MENEHTSYSRGLVPPHTNYPSHFRSGKDAQRCTPSPSGLKERLAKNISKHEQPNDSGVHLFSLFRPDRSLCPLSGEDNGDSVPVAKALIDGGDCSSKQL